MNKKITYINGGTQDMRRPMERPPKSNWKIELLKKGLGVLQHVSTRKTTEIVWHHFTKPGRSRFTENQKLLIDRAEKSTISYMGYEIQTYKWGNSQRKVLLAHGWNSKVADFRRMIDALVEAGFQVEGMDMKAHGQSSGKHTALPEFRDILKNYYVQNGPFESVIGYSMGGLASGIMLSELSSDFQPENFFVLAAPSHTRYFFQEIIAELGYKDEVYDHMCEMLDERYKSSVDYFDMRAKTQQLSPMNVHLIYDEDDKTVVLDRGRELLLALPKADFVQTKGLGHYQIIAHEEVIQYIIDRHQLN